jgi:GNAT superfamily N-acetyltransferase
MAPRIEVTLDAGEAEREAVMAPLLEYNIAAAGTRVFKKIALLIKDSAGATTGGLYGYIAFDWLFVELFFIPAELRGQDLGSKLLAQAEALARAHECAGVWLDTFSFQAPGFYRKQGYEMFGSIDEYPRGHQRHFFRKVLERGA